MNNVKTDTKEKFTVVKPQFEVLSANLAVELVAYLKTFLEKEVTHIILDLGNITQTSSMEANLLIDVQNHFYDKQSSFVICALGSSLLPLFKESINITPTESEAWDIVQMEEIERELLNNFNDL